MDRGTGLLSELAEWATSIRHSEIPQVVVDHAKKSLLNWLAVTWAGQETPEGKIFAQFGKSKLSTASGDSIVIGMPSRVPSTHAAFANAANAHVLDFDDTHLSTVIHPSAPVYAALLSIIQEDSSISGIDVLTAFAVGSELFIRLGLAMNPAHYDTGWHITASLGAIGGAFAVAKLVDFSVEESTTAAALAGLGTSGFRAAFGTMGKPYQVGMAASNAVLACDMAAMGADGPEDLMEHRRGLIITTDGIDESAFADLGAHWHFLDNSFKPYPCGVVTHPIIDAGIRIHQLGLDPGDIREVRGLVHPLVNELTGIRSPTEGLDGKFSANYLMALAIIDGYVMPEQFTKDCIARAEIRSLMERISFEDSPSVHRDAVEVEVRLVDGSERTITVHHASGSIQNPLNWPQLDDKFGHLTKAWGPSAREEMVSLVHQFENEPRAWRLLEHIDRVNRM